jgi:hypothetical protein
MASYSIYRFEQDGRRYLVYEGLSLEEAQAHCNDESTHGDRWFDGYEEEKELRTPEPETATDLLKRIKSKGEKK